MRKISGKRIRKYSMVGRKTEIRENTSVNRYENVGSMDGRLDGWMGQICLSTFQFPAEFIPELRDCALKDFNVNFTKHFQ